MREVLETTKRVSQLSRHIRIDREAVHRFAEELVSDGMQIPPWDAFHHLTNSNEDRVAYYLVLDTLNFCFWPPEGKNKWEIQYKSKEISGYNALAASLKQAVENNTPILNTEYLAGLTLQQLQTILKGKGELQLMDQRLNNLNELGRMLLETYKGKAHLFIEAADHSAVTLVRLLAENLSSYQDTAPYQGHEVFFYKRAQILAADLFGALGGAKWGHFTDMQHLTAFADYKLPQVLRHLGILHYEDSLAEKVDQFIYLDPGSEEEIEIRANTIQAVEWIRKELEGMGKDLRSYEIDWMLWNLGQRESFRAKPYHRTLSIFY